MLEIIEVKTAQDKKDFLHLPIRLYKNDKNWIRPIDADIEEVFDTDKNKFFRHGVCTRWIAKENGEVVGRVAAFIDKKTEKNKNSLGQQLHTGGMGFFESIDDKLLAFKLFETSKNWLESQEMNSMEGPINFGTRDNWWGLLVDGFEIEPNYKMPYTKPYYQEFFEDYGFQIYFRQLTYGRKAMAPLLPKYKEQADKIFLNKRYSFEHLKMNQLEKYTEDFRTIYNKAWVNHAGAKEMTSLQAKAIMKSMKPIIDPKTIFFAYYDGEPIAFFLNLPEVNQIIKHIKHGRLDWLGKLIFVWHKLLGTNKKLTGRGFGIVPEHQGKGVVQGIVEYSRIIVQDNLKGKYLDYEMNWIGDFNKKMIAVVETIGSPVKVHHTYRIAFDADLVIEKCPVIE
jgi:hypothetical protein